jgi:subtilisin family serine protease
MRFWQALSILLLLFLSSALVANAQTHDPGDVNGDGIVNVLDALLVIEWIEGIANLSTNALQAADLAAPFGPPYNAQTITRADAEAIMQTALGTIPGDPNEPLENNIPDIPVPPATEDDISIDDRPDGTSLPTSRTRIMLVFKPGTTVGQANAAITRVSGRTVGTVPEIGLFIIQIPDIRDFSGLENALNELRSIAYVAIAVQDVLLEAAVIPYPSNCEDDTPTHDVGNPWIWDLPPSSGLGTDGNWGLEAVRAPQMWNVKDFIERANHSILTGIADVGFEDANRDGQDDHFDLDQLRTPNLAQTSAHGQHVAGIIGATYDDQALDNGVTGVNPKAEMVGVAADTPRNLADIGSSVMAAIVALVTDHPNVRVANISMGYNWARNTCSWNSTGDICRPATNPNTSASAQFTVILHGMIMRLIAKLAPRVVFVFAAGNDSSSYFQYPSEILALWASPGTWAGLGPDVTIPGFGALPSLRLPAAENVVVVESIDAMLLGETEHRKSDFSNVGGHISAPGGKILSTVLNNHFDTKSGTSMAAPHVTGVIGYLLAFDPTLQAGELHRLLVANARDDVDEEVGGHTGPSGEGVSDRLDAFATLLGIDSIRSGNPIQRALVDVDDGTLDGNLREDRNQLPYTTIDTADSLRGDRHVDMKDFRAFRDALIYVEGTHRNNLDGADDHPKKDLNLDGCVHGTGQPNCPDENVYPRFDFNGDGKIHRTDTEPFKGQLKTDLDVLKDVWGTGTDIEGWSADQLSDLLDSGDVHLDLSQCIAAHHLDEVVVTVISNPQPASRVFDPSTTEAVFTVPSSQSVQIAATGLRGGAVVATGTLQVTVQPGEDKWETLTCTSTQAANLYAGTYDPGYVFRYEGGSTWTNISGGELGLSVHTLVMFDGHL